MCEKLSDKQKLVDLCFAFVLTATSDNEFCKKSEEEKAEWVKENLDAMGFKTQACGISWGVLVREDN